jgi:hypothetical protein
LGWRIQMPGIAWVSLWLVVALHVADEAANGFLVVYNPAVLRMRQKLPLLTFPTFEFEVWIPGLLWPCCLACRSHRGFSGDSDGPDRWLLLGHS